MYALSRNIKNISFVMISQYLSEKSYNSMLSCTIIIIIFFFFFFTRNGPVSQLSENRFWCQRSIGRQKNDLSLWPWLYLYVKCEHRNYLYRWLAVSDLLLHVKCRIFLRILNSRSIYTQNDCPSSAFFGSPNRICPKYSDIYLRKQFRPRSNWRHKWIRIYRVCHSAIIF